MIFDGGEGDYAVANEDQEECAYELGKIGSEAAAVQRCWYADGHDCWSLIEKEKKGS